MQQLINVLPIVANTLGNVVISPATPGNIVAAVPTSTQVKGNNVQQVQGQDKDKDKDKGQDIPENVDVRLTIKMDGKEPQELFFSASDSTQSSTNPISITVPVGNTVQNGNLTQGNNKISPSSNIAHTITNSPDIANITKSIGFVLNTVLSHTGNIGASASASTNSPDIANITKSIEFVLNTVLNTV